MNATKLVAVLAVAGLALAACGDDEESSSDTNAAGTTAGATEATTAGATEATTAGATEATTAGATGDTTAATTGDTMAGATGDTTAATTGDTMAGATGATGATTAGTTDGTTAGATGDTTGGTTAGTTGGTTAGTAGGQVGTCAPEGDISIGLVTDTGKVDDKSFNQSAWEGAQAAAESVGGSADFIETVSSSDYENNIDQFVQSGANVIITVGFGMAEATVVAAEANPEVCFIGVDQFQGETLQNISGLIFPEDQAGFLAGALAAQLTESDTIASVLGTDQVPPVVAFGEGFELGAQHINPDINVLTTFHPGGLDTAFNDPEWGAQTARQAIDNGADIVFGAGGNTGNGALTEVAKDGGDVLCIGVDTDQWETVPDAHPCLVTSAMKLINPGIVELVELGAGEGIPSGNFLGDVGLADYHDLADRVPEDVQAAMEELTPQVLSGEVPTGYQP